jgi:hypothetical protein
VRRRRRAVVLAILAVLVVVAFGYLRATNEGADGGSGIDDALVEDVDDGEAVEVEEGTGCEALPAAGTSSQCDVIDTGGDEAAYVVETSIETEETTVRVLRRTSPTAWQEVLRAGPDRTEGYEHVEARVGDMNGDDVGEVVVLYRETVDGGQVAVDVIDIAKGEVAAHHEQDGGVIRFVDGVLETWEARNDTNTEWRHVTIKLDGEVIRVEAESTDEPPPNDTF